MKGCIIILCLAFCISGCSGKLSKQDFIRWYQGIKPMDLETGKHKISVRYFPVEILMMDKKNVSSEEMLKKSELLWVTLDIDKKQFFPSMTQQHHEHGTTLSHEEKNKELDVKYADKKPDFEMNEFSTGSEVEGRWILGWQDKADKTRNLKINIDDTIINIPCENLIPSKRPQLKI